MSELPVDNPLFWILYILIAAKFFLLGTIWGQMRAAHAIKQSIGER